MKERRREKMSRSILSSAGVRRIIPLVIVLGLLVGWATVAFAQSSSGGQYGNPTATASGNPGSSGSSASTASGDAGGGGGSGGGGSGGGGSGGGGSGGGGSGGGGSGGSGPGGITTLPATGGPLSPLVAGGGILVLGSAGLLALRRR